MKKKVPFSLEYRNKIESGEVEVVTRDDRHVDILKWDAKGKFPIITLITFEDGHQSPWSADAQGANLMCSESKSDLFLLVEEELTEFQALLQEFANMLFENYTDEDHIIFSSTLESWEKKFLEYAENQLEKKFRIQSFQQGYDLALEDTQKALLDSVPKWKYLAKGASVHSKGSKYLRRGPKGSHNVVPIVMGECDYIDIEELDKLPKEERV